MELSVKYLGLRLAHPFMPGASPLVDDLDNVRRLEDAGASAIVMHSLFEEQIVREQVSSFLHLDRHGESFAEALCFFPRAESFALGPEEYLAHLARVKAAVRVPVIASLNGTTPGRWLEYAKAMEQAGADALELNVYALAVSGEESGQEVEDRTVAIVKQVRSALRIPLAVKLAPFYTSLPHFARRLVEAGADGLVLFNRFVQPDIDPENLEMRRLELSSPSELPLRLRWLAVLHGQLRASLACSGGVHGSISAVKAIMAGADVVQVVSALMLRGPEFLARLRAEFLAWAREHEYESVDQMRGNMSLRSCPDPAVYERANYMLALQTWNRA